MPDTAKSVRIVFSGASVTADGGVTASAANLILAGGQQHEASAASANLCCTGSDIQDHPVPTPLVLGGGGDTENHGVTESGTVVALSAAGEDFHGDTANERYELFHALNDAEFDWAHPDVTFTTLPHTTAGNYGANGLHRFVLRRRNLWGLSDRNVAEQVFNILGGVQIARPPSAVIRPRLEQVYHAPWHVVHIRGEYYAGQDPDNPASYFWMWYETDGSTPANPRQNMYEPTDVLAMNNLVGTARILMYDVGIRATNGQIVKAYVAAATGPTLATGVCGTISDLLTLTVNTQPPVAPVHKGIRHLRSERTR